MTRIISAELLTIGDEILYGQIVDTNSQWMSVELSNAGIKVIRKTSVGDQEHEIITAFAEAEKRADIVLITGGLGPTSDDLTKPCLAKYFNCEIKMNAELAAFLLRRHLLKQRSRSQSHRLIADRAACRPRLLPSACDTRQQGH